MTVASCSRDASWSLGISPNFDKQRVHSSPELVDTNTHFIDDVVRMTLAPLTALQLRQSLLNVLKLLQFNLHCKYLLYLLALRWFDSTLWRKVILWCQLIELRVFLIFRYLSFLNMQSSIFEQILEGQVTPLTHSELLEFQGFCSARNFSLEQLISASVGLYLFRWRSSRQTQSKATSSSATWTRTNSANPSTTTTNTRNQR